MAIFLVVVGHALPLYNGVGFASFAFDFIYSFHMPLFFFISGFCALSLSERTDIKTDGKEVWKRVKRLLIPYFVYGVLYVPMDIIGGNYSWSEFHLGNYLLDLLRGDNANWQLWTLYTLFFCAVLYLILRRFLKGKTILAVSAILFVTRTIIDGIPNYPSFLYITILSKLTSNFFFYCLGLEYRKYIESGGGISDDWKLWGLAIFALLGLNVFKFIYTDLYVLLLLTSCLGIYVFLFLSYKLENIVGIEKMSFSKKCQKTANKVFMVMGDYCMPIYLFSNIFQVLIREFLLERWEWNIHFCFALSSLLPIVLSILIAKFIVRKSKVLKTVFLGE